MNIENQQQQPTVLIVDDNPTNIKVVGLVLRPLRYKIVIATNGEQAIDMVERIRPDLVLLDVMMPKLDGFEACRIIKSKEENDNIAVIFMTALSDVEDVVKGFEAGGVDYITKPFNKEELISRVKTHIELKLTRDKLEKTTTHLTELNALKDKMFSVIGHDLRSPLSSVKMTLEFLSETATTGNEELAETIGIIMQTTDEIFGLLENLLGWAKSQSGNLSLNKEEIKLEETIQNIYRLNKSNFDNKQITFTSKVKDEDVAFADLNTLKVVLRNLLSNAIKFTPNNKTIEVLTEQLDDKIQILVRDTGVGIPKDKVDKLFNSNEHFTTYGTNQEAGSGLGLLLCKDFTERNNGKIWVESEEGKGSTFFIELPIKSQEE